jgi:Aminoglycoside 3-N-acetyltransferase
MSILARFIVSFTARAVEVTIAVFEGSTCRTTSFTARPSHDRSSPHSSARSASDPGSVGEVHCGLSSLSFVVGGADAVVLALLEAVGSGGTLLALTGWDHDSLWPGGWPEPVRRAYLEDPPIFDPQPSEAARDQGLAAVLALALVQPWGRSLTPPLLLAAGWLAASIMILWGGAVDPARTDGGGRRWNG